MPSIPLVFGGGLDRETGVMAMQPGGMDDLRNVHLLSGKFQVRRGFEETFTFPDVAGIEQTDVLAGIAVLGQRGAIYVTYGAEDGKVHFWESDAEATWVRYVDEWPFLKPSGVASLAAYDDPPVVILAEYNGIVFAADSRNTVVSRAQTYYLQKDAVTKVWAAHGLTVDWGGIQEVRFRGVFSHLEYIGGWGWGDETEDRPELVRVCEPGDPLSWDPLHYWIVGDEGDPVIACYPAAGTLIGFKETQTWELFGDNFANFGQRMLDRLFGMQEPRLAVEVEGAVFAWTNEGPRIFTGRGTSEGVELPLELYLPEPYDLVEKGEDKYAFAVYMPVYRSVWWVFNRRVYSLYIRVDGDWKWGYQELGFDALCGFRLPQAGWGMVEAPTGYPSSPVLSSIGDTTATLTVDNNSPDGDETLEVWLRDAGETEYSLHQSFGVEAAATQAVDLTGLTAGWDIELAVRWRRGPWVTAGYEDDDPSAWPSTALTSFTTTLALAPTISSHQWSRVSASVEKVSLGITSPYTGTGYTVEVRRDTVAAGSEVSPAASFTFDDTGITGETTHSHDCRVVTPYVNGPYATAVSTWTGPFAPTLTQATSVLMETYTCTWTNAQSAATEIWDNLPTLTPDDRETLRGTEAADSTLFQSPAISGSTGTQPDITIRHKLTQYGVDDFSNWSASMQVDVAIG